MVQHLISQWWVMQGWCFFLWSCILIYTWKLVQQNLEYVGMWMRNKGWSFKAPWKDFEEIVIKTGRLIGLLNTIKCSWGQQPTRLSSARWHEIPLQMWEVLGANMHGFAPAPCLRKIIFYQDSWVVYWTFFYFLKCNLWMLWGSVKLTLDCKYNCKAIHMPFGINLVC